MYFKECDEKNNGNTSAINRLYKILVTKPNIYDEFICVLETHRQAGAVAILAPLSDHCYAQLLDVPTTWLKHGKRTTLRIALSQLTTDDAHRILANKECQGYFGDLLSTPKPVVCVNGNLRKCSALYLKRTLSNRLTINPTIFRRTDCTDVFVIKGISAMDFAEIAKPNTTCSLRSQLQGRTLRHIYLENNDIETDWKILAESEEVAVHFIVKEGATFFHQMSNTITPILRQNAASNNDASEYITEEKFLSKLQSDSEAGVCVCDIPGMGKSWLFENLARALQNQGCIVFLLSLPKLAGKCAELSTTFQTGDNLKFILEYACELNSPEPETMSSNEESFAGSRLAAEVLKYYITKYHCKLYLFLDGFDEVMEKYVDAVKILLNEVRNEGGTNVKLCLASRPHKRKELEEAFSVVAYDILPFGKDEQVTALMKAWDINLELDQERLRLFANHCIQSCEKLQGTAKSDILGVPLKIHIVAKVNLRGARLYADPNRCEHPLSNDIAFKSVVDLFGQYVSVELERVIRKYGSSDKNSQRWTTLLLFYHNMKAMEALQLDNHIIAEFKRIARLDNYSEESRIQDLGILFHNGVNYNFTHRSFAEYFVGKFFVDYWTASQPFAGSNLFGEYFFSVILETVSKSYVALESVNPEWKNVMLDHRNFVKGTVVWFVSSLLKTESAKPTDCWNKIQSCTNNSMYAVIIACIEEDFVSVVDLLRVVLSQSVQTGSYFGIFTAAKENFYISHENIVSSDDVKREKQIWLDENLERASIAYLLSWLAQKGSIGMANTLLRLFRTVDDIRIQTICANLPQSWISPLEHAIKRNNIDMTVFFLNNNNYQHLGPINILNKCLKGQSMTNADIPKRQSIIQAVLKKYNMCITENTVEFIELIGEPNDYNLVILKWLTEEYDIKWSTLSNDFKKAVVENMLRNLVLNDESLRSLLEVFFGIRRQTIHQKENLANVKRIFKKTADSHEWFSHLDEIDSLKIIMNIFGDFSDYSIEGKTLLHISVQHGKADWVRYLVSEGFEVNKVDKHNNTPLLSIASKNSIDITKILLKNGANIHAVNNKRRNVAHMLVYSVPPDEYLEWFKYLLDKGN